MNILHDQKRFKSQVFELIFRSLNKPMGLFPSINGTSKTTLSKWAISKKNATYVIFNSLNGNCVSTMFLVSMRVFNMSCCVGI